MYENSNKNKETEKPVVKHNVLRRIIRIFPTYAREEKNTTKNRGKNTEKNNRSYKFGKGVFSVSSVSEFLKVQTMSYSDFIKAGLIVKLHSDLLNEDFYIVSNQDIKPMVEAQSPGMAVYLPDEILHLGRMAQEDVLKIHMAKKIFNGEVISQGKQQIEGII